MSGDPLDDNNFSSSVGIGGTPCSLPLPTSFGGLYDYLTIEICKFIVILSPRVPILANRAKILVNFLSFGREMRRISNPET